jgi:hypothetical protein
LKGCYLASKAVYESGDDFEDAIMIIDKGQGLIDKALDEVEKCKSSILGKQMTTSAVGEDGDSPVEKTRRVSEI